jgi:hypothetical protein
VGVSTFPSWPLNCDVSTTDRFGSGPWRHSRGYIRSPVQLCTYEWNTLSHCHKAIQTGKNKVKISASGRRLRTWAGAVRMCKSALRGVRYAYLEMLGNVHGMCSTEAILESETQNTTKTDEEQHTRTRMHAQLNNYGVLVIWTSGETYWTQNVVNFPQLMFSATISCHYDAPRTMCVGMFMKCHYTLVCSPRAAYPFTLNTAVGCSKTPTYLKAQFFTWPLTSVYAHCRPSFIKTRTQLPLSGATSQFRT